MFSCINCSGDTIKEEVVEVEYPVRGRRIKISSEAMVCNGCGGQYMTIAQMQKTQNLVKAKLAETS